MTKKFLLGKAPFVRHVDDGDVSTSRMMADLLIALVPIIIFSWIKNGILPYFELNEVSKNGASVITMIYPLLFVFIGGFTSFLLETIYFYTFLKIRTFKELMKSVLNSFAIIPGVLLALILPLKTPIVALIFGCFLANIVFKMLFGGFGKNVFNPALIAYAILTVSFSLTSSYFNPSETLNVVTGVTPLTNFAGTTINYANVVAPYGNLWDFFIGTIPGSLGETSALLCIVAYIWLVVRKVINWRVPVIYIGTVYVITLIIALVNGYGMWYPMFNILSGGLFFGAVFMATEPVTTPRNPHGKVIFAVGCGVLTVLFRIIGMYPEGVCTAILTMCLFTPVIDRFAATIRSSRINYKSILKYSAVAILFIAIAIYTIIKAKDSTSLINVVKLINGGRL